MPLATDDASVTGDQHLIRVLLPKWTVVKNGRERPTSDSLLDSNYENSCFVEEEVGLGWVQQAFPGRKVGRLPVIVVRRKGFSIERRPGDAPRGCPTPEAHVVVGPIPVPDRWGEYEGKARSIVKDAAVEIIDPPDGGLPKMTAPEPVT
jgi:hypothetical protein